MANEPVLNADQQKAVDFPHTNPVIVSAAAGSGKTTLLVQRVIRLLTDEKLDIKADSLGIMTFTKNATRALRQKLNTALRDKAEKLSENPQDKKQRDYLEEQIFALRQASISTIDAFCLKIIKDNPEAFDLPVTFTVADTAKLTEMQMQAVKLAMQDFYNNNGIFTKDERENLFYSFSFEKDDALQKAVVSAADKLSAYADADKWLSESISLYSSTETLENEYLEVLIPIISSNIASIRAAADKYDNIITLITDELEGLINSVPEKPKAADKKKLQDRLNFKADNLQQYKKYIDFDKKRISDIEEKFDAFKNNARAEPFKALIGCINENKAPLGGVKFNTGCKLANKPLLTAAKNDFQKAVESLLKIEYDEKFERETLSARQTVLKTFIKLLNAYRGHLEGIKKDRGCIDFSYAELLLLKKLSADEQFRKQLSEQFACIIVDEFQDSNDIQAEIFKKIGSDNLFYVGDVKQSIYAFRGGNPEIMARLCEKNNADGFTELPLNKNYRSRAEVIDTVNAAFSGLMTRGCGGVEYSIPENRLVRGAEYETGEESVGRYNSEIHILNTSEIEYDDKSLAGARYTANLIKKLIDEKFPVGKNKAPCKYSDIAVLMRNRSKIASYRQALAELGIPSCAPKGNSFLDAAEVQLVINFLKVIDNPLHDEEMLNILMSPVYRFTAQDVSELRLGLSGIDPSRLTEKQLKAVSRKMKRYSLFRCLTKCLEPLIMGEFIENDIRILERSPSPKITRFTSDLTEFRYNMASLSLYDLIRKIYEDTDLINITAAFDNSAGRVANIRRLMDIAYDFETNGGGSLNDFLRFLERASNILGKNIEEAASPEETADCVQIMTYHASKGLEFPVCIIAEVQTSINKSDYTGTLLMDREYHMAIKYTDFKKRVKRKDFAYGALEKIVYKSRCGEELRLLYVAMTRAMEKLIMIGSFSDKIISTAPLDPKNTQAVFESRQPFKWIFSSLARYLTDDRSTFKEIPCRLIMSSADGMAPETAQVSEEKYDISDEEIEEISELMNRKYPYESDTHRQAKFSVTELARKDSDLPVLLSAPSFAKKSKNRYSGTEKGNAYHHCMEFFPFEKILSANGEDYLEITLTAIKQMMEKKQITQRESDIIVPENIAGFFGSALGQRMLKSPHIVREESFYAEVNGKILGEDYDGELSVQGRTDLYFVEDGEIVVVDYKSDTKNNLNKEITNYARQVKIYGEVLPKLTGMKVKQIYLYAFLSGDAIEINENNTV